jgi:hypothetical protein
MTNTADASEAPRPAASGTPLPPALTRALDAPQSPRDGSGVPLPPYLPGRAAAFHDVHAAPLELTDAMELEVEEDIESEGWPDLPDQGAAVPAWDDGDNDAIIDSAARAEASGSTEFPLDAFFVPTDSKRVPMGYDDAEHREVAGRVADRLEEMAQAVRARGMPALGAAPTSDELAKLIAAVVAGFFARERK